MRTACLLMFVATIAAEDLVELRSVPLRVRSSYERIDLNADERMGLGGLHLDVLDATPIPGLYGGLGGYGAAGGDRGGLFVFGATLGWRTPAWNGLRLDANGFAGGGGGANAGQGDGLMLRGQVLATFELGSWEVGGGVARTDFPNGEIADTGWSVGLNHLVDGTLAAPWQGAEATSAVLTSERWSIAPQFIAYRTGDDDRGRSGAVLAKRIDLAGIAVGYYLGDDWWLPLQMAAAVNGGAAGYMEVFGGIAWRPAIVGGLHLDARLLGGLGGGGDIDTGGGLMARPELGLALALTHSSSIAARGGWVTTADGNFDGAVLIGELNWDSEHLALASGSTRATLPATTTSLERWRVVVGDALYHVRSSDADDIHLVSIAIERALSPYLSLVGRARSAWHGDVGGYSEGLFGARLGAHWWRLALALQAQVGAGGGGGLDTGDGVIGDLQLTGRVRLTDQLALHLGGGRVEAHDGAFSADVLEAALVWSLAVAR